MKVTTKFVMSMITGEALEHEWFEYSGPVALSKGGDTAKSQMDLQNKLTQQQLDMQNKTLSEIKSGVGKYLSGDIGFGQDALSNMQSSFLNNNALQFQNAGSAVRDALTARGANGSLPVGGSYTRGLSSLMGAQASSQAQGLQNLAIQNAQQALANKFNAGSLLSGNAATLSSNVGTFNSGASSALEQYIKAKNSGPLNTFLGGLGQGLGGGLGAYMTGGLGGVSSAAKPGGGGNGGGPLWGGS